MNSHLRRAKSPAPRIAFPGAGRQSGAPRRGERPGVAGGPPVPRAPDDGLHSELPGGRRVRRPAVSRVGGGARVGPRAQVHGERRQRVLRERGPPDGARRQHIPDAEGGAAGGDVPAARRRPVLHSLLQERRGREGLPGEVLSASRILNIRGVLC